MRTHRHRDGEQLCLPRLDAASSTAPVHPTTEANQTCPSEDSCAASPARPTSWPRLLLQGHASAGDHPLADRSSLAGPTGPDELIGERRRMYRLQPAPNGTKSHASTRDRRAVPPTGSGRTTRCPGRTFSSWSSIGLPGLVVVDDAGPPVPPCCTGTQVLRLTIPGVVPRTDPRCCRLPPSTRSRRPVLARPRQALTGRRLRCPTQSPSKPATVALPDDHQLLE